ncbi:translation initiation factor IF-2-like [Prionailurus viverrinus]|uniref:translation initiation factor IF-2-like n=1 Tax=Prionailurus viverrinus TaxID=61388 RepID=UPI001FF3B518|nr:translation initiation factor IF-2-like [Prionailurus viverrinus]
MGTLGEAGLGHPGLGSPGRGSGGRMGELGRTEDPLSVGSSRSGGQRGGGPRCCQETRSTPAQSYEVSPCRRPGEPLHRAARGGRRPVTEPGRCVPETFRPRSEGHEFPSSAATHTGRPRGAGGLGGNTEGGTLAPRTQAPARKATPSGSRGKPLVGMRPRGVSGLPHPGLKRLAGRGGARGPGPRRRRRRRRLPAAPRIPSGAGRAQSLVGFEGLCELCS